MGNIIDYVKEYGDHTFSEKGITEVDSLVLCQICYYKLEGFVPGLEEKLPSVTLRSICEQADYDRLFADDWYKENNQLLLEAMSDKVRFMNLKLNDYVGIINPENETQFAAVTFILDDKTAYIAYRGTDETIVGWKEDFNMAFSKPVHSQLLSVDYLIKTAGSIAGGFYVGGHSKGGNLAVYAAMYCECEDIQKRIIKVFNNDGPGFRPEISGDGHYERITDRTKKFIPRSSLVGMVLESHVDYETIESNSIGVFQHNPYSWQVEGDEFVRAKDIRTGKKFRDETLNKWILSLTDEELHIFVDKLYEVIASTGAEDMITFTSDFTNNMKMVRKAMKDMDEENKKMIGKIIRSLFKMAGHEFRTRNKNKKEQEAGQEIRTRNKEKVVDRKSKNV